MAAKATAKCPKCSWRGSWAQYMKHYKKHYKAKQKAKGPRRSVWPTPPYARRK